MVLAIIKYLGNNIPNFIKEEYNWSIYECYNNLIDNSVVVINPVS